MFKIHDIVQSENFYTLFYTRILKQKNEEFWRRIRFLKYEDLVTNPTETYKQLENFTNINGLLSSTEKMWESNKIDYQQERLNKNPAITPLYGERISTVSVDAYKDILSKRNLRKIEQQCWLIMNLFDYYNR